METQEITLTSPTQPVRDTLPNILRGEDGAVAHATNADGVTVQVEFHQSRDRRLDFYLWYQPGLVFCEDDMHMAFACNREFLADSLYDDYHLDLFAPVWTREVVQ